LQNEPLICGNLDAELTYLIPDGTLINFPLLCKELENGVYFSIKKDHEACEKIRIENYQYFRFNVKYKGPKLVMDKTKLYLLYKGNNVLFSGDDVTFDTFTSLELPFGYFYKTQLAPFIVRNVTNLW